MNQRKVTAFRMFILLAGTLMLLAGCRIPFVRNKVPKPVISPPTGTYYSEQTVTIACKQNNSTIRYTLDGSDPTSSSAVYTGAVTILANKTLKARAYFGPDTPSEVAEAVYTLDLSNTVAIPAFYPTPGSYTEAQSVTIHSNTAGAAIYYTLDGSAPTQTSTQYTVPIPVSATITIKARAYKTGYVDSAIAIGAYVFDSPPPGLILVSGGTFSNGTANVTLSGFYLGRYEVKQTEYFNIMNVNPSFFNTVADAPVDGVSWFKAVEYCNRRSMAESLQPCYSYLTYGSNPSNWPAGWSSDYHNSDNLNCDWNAGGYRLPTEMEWMFASKGGTQSQSYDYSGSDDVTAVAWYLNNSGSTTHSVGTKAPNELGIYDLSGNLLEWVWDRWEYTYPAVAQTNPHGPESGYTDRTVRGGGYNNVANQCTLVYRSLLTAQNGSGMGFRVCRKA
jgi:formylglycine-generating enzyme